MQSHSLPPPSPIVQRVQNPIATLDPPMQYWRVYHERWVQDVGEATFFLDQSCLMQRKNGPNTYYLCLWLKPLEHVFPVVQPHISLGVVEFPNAQANWVATLQCQSYLWPRRVTGQFQRYGDFNFALKEGNELSALIQLLRETLKKGSTATSQMDRWPHITWNQILKFGHWRPWERLWSIPPSFLEKGHFPKPWKQGLCTQLCCSLKKVSFLGLAQEGWGLQLEVAPKNRILLHFLLTRQGMQEAGINIDPWKRTQLHPEPWEKISARPSTLKKVTCT